MTPHVLHDLMLSTGPITGDHEEELGLFFNLTKSHYSLTAAAQPKHINERQTCPNKTTLLSGASALTVVEKPVGTLIASSCQIPTPA